MKHFSYTCGGQTILLARRDKDIFYKGGDKLFTSKERTKFFTSRGGQTFIVDGGGGYFDAGEEMNVSKASKLSAGARILGAHGAMKFLYNITKNHFSIKK